MSGSNPLAFGVPTVGSNSSSVLDAIAHPQLVNPLAAIMSANQAAASTFNLRALQSQQQIGDILQQATDPRTGTVDHARAQALAAQAGPGVQMGMQTFLTNNSALRGAQQTQVDNHQKIIARAFGSVLYDPSDTNINAQADELIRGGYPAEQINHGRQQLLAMQDPAQRKSRAYSNLQQLLSGTEVVDRGVGRTTGENLGGDIGAVTVRPEAPGQPASITRSATGVGTTLSPSELSAVGITVPATQAMVDEALKQGRTDVVLGKPTAIPRSDMVGGMGLAAVLPPHIRQQYLQQQPATRPPANVQNPDRTTVSPGNPAQATRPPLRQLNLAPAPSLTNQPVFQAPTAVPPTFAPGGGPAPPPTVRPAGPAPGPRVPTSALDAMGGVQTASTNPLEAPVTGLPSPANPLVPGDVQAILTGMQGARDTPRISGTQTAGAGYSYGPGIEEDATTKLSGERYASDKRMALDHAKTVLPIAQALSIYGRGGVTTAPGAAEANTARGWVNGVLRSAGLPELLSTTTDYDDLNKALAGIATNSQTAGRSDAALAATLAGNASTHIHEIVGADKLKANIAQIRAGAVANSQWDNMTQEQRAPYKYQYSNFLQDFNKTFDLRAGAYDMYTPAQAKTLLDDLNAHTPAYRKQFFDSVRMVRRNGYMGETRTIP